MHTPIVINTLPEANSSPLKIGRAPKGKWSPKYQFSGAKVLVSGRVKLKMYSIHWGYPPPTNSEIIICSYIIKGPPKKPSLSTNSGPGIPVFSKRLTLYPPPINDSANLRTDRDLIIISLRELQAWWWPVFCYHQLDMYIYTPEN